MKPPIPTPEPVPVQTLRRYGLNATADEVAEVYRQHGELVAAAKSAVLFYERGKFLTDDEEDIYGPLKDALSLATATQKKG